MGGYGSGRPSHKRKTEHCLSLDVNRLHRDGALEAGRRGDRVWSRNGDEVGRIGYHATEQSLVLNYRTRPYGADWQSVSEAVPIDRAPCRYGGQRPYFRCPGVIHGRHCNRRVVKLYMGGTYFLCRHCYNLAYTSQSEPAYDRALRRANKRRVALGGEPGTAYLIAPKPKGMWQRTYQRNGWKLSATKTKQTNCFSANSATFSAKKTVSCFSVAEERGVVPMTSNGFYRNTFSEDQIWH